MKNPLSKLSASALLLALLSACSGNNGGGSTTDNNGGGNTGGGTTTSSSQLKTIASASSTDQPVEIADPASLQRDITGVFGAADGNPVPVNTGDTVQTVISRAAGQ
jgi:hypothetical protein